MRGNGLCILRSSDLQDNGKLNLADEKNKSIAGDNIPGFVCCGPRGHLAIFTLPGEELKVSEESSEEEKPCDIREEDLLVLLLPESSLTGG